MMYELKRHGKSVMYGTWRECELKIERELEKEATLQKPYVTIQNVMIAGFTLRQVHSLPEKGGYANVTA